MSEAMSLAERPSAADKKAAHEFLTELRTRIATQSLPYQYGIEASALQSLFDLFGFGRTAIKDNPGCELFAAKVTQLLNVELRPVTSKWHRAKEAGVLDSRDGADAFRGELHRIQRVLREFADEFHQMAYGTSWRDQDCPGALAREDVEGLFEALRFGIPDAYLPDGDPREINRDEAGDIGQRRKQYLIETPEGEDAVGLALSGGGIRSATFGLGVVQVLADHLLLHQVDYLSTVSGGGYTGSFISSRLSEGVSVCDLGKPHGPDPDAIRYVRQRAKFLSAQNLKQAWGMATATLGGMLLNWMAPLFVIAAIVELTLLTQPFLKGYWQEALNVLAGLSALSLIGWGVAMRWRPDYASKAGWLFGTLTGFTLLGYSAQAIGNGYKIALDVYVWLKAHWTFPAVIGGLITATPAAMRFLPIFKEPKLRRIVLQVLLWSAGLLIPIVGLLLGYALWHLRTINVAVPVLECVPGDWALLAILAASGVIAFWVLNINLTGPHRLYRDGLSRTFIGTVEQPYRIVELAKLNSGNQAPYHLVNTALNLPSSERPNLQDRRCDFFLFSKYWMGAPSVGYTNTASWRANGKPVDLATAMATSGAALSAHMGLGAMPTLTALLAVLNLRLGFWIKNPRIWSPFSEPGFLCLIREMFGVGMSERKAWLNLSDGGHIENMAVYELLRRRCKFIVCVDGEADPGFGFGGLMTLVRHAQIDFGVRIEPALDDIRPNPASGFSRSHAQFCVIDYPAIDATPAGTGFLLYLKLSVTGNEPALIKRYRLNHPDFPHQTTLDQFFDEEQFEAYRQLGVHIAEGLFSSALVGDTPPETIAAWFERLAANLLLPNCAR
ncbi:patatin-like phospholipase family protein [Methylomonas sp. MV1]|uniref:patatin-like phospholipase family protein n=1 Tax=Methylomonas sp. MV1 TaxID=3073620 RepID=UPI0028A5620D|nr:patatin-like phospholipase family protein [Methylomonas sp. MV1]MDT4329035.1 patatin-like phospholipase family protein [Methylomonas sp. MV1]